MAGDNLEGLCEEFHHKVHFVLDCLRGKGWQPRVALSGKLRYAGQLRV